MVPRAAVLAAAASAAPRRARGTAALHIVRDVPGRAASTEFTASVRLPGGDWTTAFVLQTTARNHTDPDFGNGYFEHLDLWSASWISVELPAGGGGAEVRVQRTGRPVTSATVHPVSSGAGVVSVSGDGAVVSVPGPARFTVDFDGGMDTTDTGPDYKKKPPVHTFSVFVNPPLPAPDPADPSVLTLEPGDVIPAALPPNSTVLFRPGVHRVPRGAGGWRVYTLQPYVRYFVPADAVWHTALDTGAWGSPSITLEGYGVVSGEDLSRDAHNSTAVRCSGEAVVHAAHELRRTGRGGACAAPNNSPQGLTIRGAKTARVEGVTLVDFPNHHMITQTTDCERSVMRNVKVLGWRANGDGLHVFGGWRVERLFMRTQDDTLYLSAGSFPKDGCAATTFAQITAWNDANGAAFIACGSGTRLSDSDVVYARASWPWWSGGRAFTHRQDFQGSCFDVEVDGVRVEDPLPSLNAFELKSNGPDTGATYRGIRFRDVRVAAASTVRACPAWGGDCNCVPACAQGPLPNGIPNVIAGASAAVNVTDLSFDDVTIGGVGIRDLLAVEGPHAGAFNVSRGFVFNLTVDGRPA